MRIGSMFFLLMITSLSGVAQNRQTIITDEIILGNASSESAHGFSGELSKNIKGGLDESARMLLPQANKNWQGGSLSFTIKVDPVKQNYITTKFWGSDINHNRLYFVCGDKQIGSRHLGDIDMLDIGNDFPFYNNRFFYTTLPLPLSLTKGKTELTFEIRSQGLIWGYGTTWEQYQKDMTEPTRGIYTVYTHTEPTFLPPGNEKQGVAPATAKRKTPGSEVLDKLKTRINNEISKLEKSVQPLNQMQMQFLAKSYRVKWSYGYKDKTVVEQVIAGLDGLYKAYKVNPNLAYSDPTTPNPDWFGFGPAADAVWLLFDEIKKTLDDKIDDGSGNKVTRKEALTEMFLIARKRNQATRRQYTNQTMIKDLYGIYYANKALQLLGSENAMPEKEVLRYLYEAVGLQPWTGSDGEDGKPNYVQGKEYWQLTNKGLTKELGFVGNYGEVIDWCVELYEATGPQVGLPGDEKIKGQIDKIALARSYFRYPMPDDDAYTAMRQEVVVGWRDTHYPGDITYAQRPSWDGGPVQMAATTLNPKLLSYAQQMLDDNQFFCTVQDRMKDNGFRVTHGLLFAPDQYEIVKKQATATYKLPMSDGQPDFIFSDEQDGVIAIKNGNEKLYASLYWRARNAINNLARVHDIMPGYDRMATVYIEEQFDSSGLFYTVPDHTNWTFGNGGLKYKDGLHLANAGEQQPIAKIPDGIPYKPGQEHPLAGRADYYKLQYGNYVIAMNASANKTFELKVPEDFETAVNLVTKEPVKTKTVVIPPLSTVVLYKKPSFAQTTSSPGGKPDFSLVNKKIQSWVDSGYYKGASVIIATNNQVLDKQYFGNYQPETVAYIASAGKWLAAATIAAVVEEGKLNWNDKVKKWLPEFKDAKGEATLAQLLSHTAGFPDYQPRGLRPDNYQTLAESVAHIISLPADTLPGTVFKYGGLAMQVAGRMAELATGKNWETLFQEKIARPLNMQLTHFTPVDETPGHNPMLGGGARASLDDYAHFLSMILQDGRYHGKRILSQASIQQMQADHIGDARVNAGEFVERARASKRKDIYGLGEWREETNENKEAILISSSSWAGAYPWIDKQNHLYGFFLARVDNKRNGFNPFYASPILPVLVREALQSVNQ